jgi:hypothetical protein
MTKSDFVGGPAHVIGFIESVHHSFSPGGERKLAI